MKKCENCQRYYSGTCSKDLNKKECNYIEINPTLEQIKQEWGEKGWYVLRDTKDYLTFFSHEDGFGVHDYDCKIKISKKSKEYEASMTGGYGVMPYFITFELHQLITKTIRALERKEKI